VAASSKVCHWKMMLPQVNGAWLRGALELPVGNGLKRMDLTDSSASRSASGEPLLLSGTGENGTPNGPTHT